MLKYQFDIKEIIYQLYTEREGRCSENNRWLRCEEMGEKFMETLNDQQKEQFKKIDNFREALECDDEKILIDFVVEFFKSLNS